MTLILLLKRNRNITNGAERREIDNIDGVEKFLNKTYKNKFKSLYFENIPFNEQVKCFNNAKLIICAHGAVMSNMFFCKKGTTIIEVVCEKDYIFFDKISRILNLNHKKCRENNFIKIELSLPLTIFKYSNLPARTFSKLGVPFFI